MKKSPLFKKYWKQRKEVRDTSFDCWMECLRAQLEGRPFSGVKFNLQLDLDWGDKNENREDGKR